VIGWITLAYVNNQYKLQQRDLLSNEINNLRIVFEREMPTDSLYRFSEKNNRLFLDFSGGHSQDLNFYNTDGDLLYTSLPKIFERGLLSQKMSSNAYYEMFISGRTEFIQDELIGKLKFLSGYTPVRNNLNNQVMGYLNLPYFANQIELKQRLSGFSNSLINVYIICFLLIGLFAIALANSLTNPLSLVEKSLGTTQIDDINKPIPWKRDDEIGDLISGYNKMIQTLEDSAKKLAKSERESAWREMAKQVAHEIKNPLTPLKLGIQHLERSWKEKDPHFEEKFIRFTKTFIEQIDSLSAISTEFSNFAQMPIAHEEKINVVEILDMVIQLFRSTENLKIELLYDIQKAYLIFADKDQISRAFTNLIKNAVQSIPESRPGMIRVGIEDLNEKIRISIEDNGIGIPREFYPKIFQPNFTTKGSGTGLGLAFVKNVVVQAGGAVDFNSTEEIGTQFIIEFPILRDR
jgi:nitrogen fixation/metabolism regulation signal transduction histidine kinase